MTDERQAPQAGRVRNRAAPGKRHHDAGHRGVATSVVALAHRARCQRLVAEKRVEQRRLARSRLAQDHRARSRGHAGADLVEPLALGGGRHDDPRPLAHEAAHAPQVVRQLRLRATIGLREHDHRRRPAVVGEHEGARHAVEQHVTRAERLNDEYDVHVCREHLLLAAAAAAPPLEARAPRQHPLDDAHVVTGRAAHRNAVAHGGQQAVVLLAVLLGKGHRVLRAKRVALGDHERKPAVEAHHKAEAHLARVLRGGEKLLVGRALRVVHAQVGEVGQVAQGVHGRQRDLPRADLPPPRRPALPPFCHATTPSPVMKRRGHYTA